MIIEKICTKCNIVEGDIAAAGDRLSVIRMGMDKDTTFSSKSKHFDMMLAINAKIQ